ncbi:ubx domain-containing protein 2 [Gigaspora margarita]|uniref:Ubx domain-containing protein 2 n=1 Tax=Gigaspora margarita TaxID=4874 RepID=A0A8H4EIA0_GIGMA|nr:ubx domain-containing protein 2 [Gigaspora margarita]
MATDKEFRKSLHDIIVKQISRNNEPENAYKCVNTLNRVVGNIIESPYDETKRQLKESNKIVKSTIREVDGGIEFLIKVGFKVKVFNFQKSIVLEMANNNDSSQMMKQLEKLEIARELLEEFLRKFKEHSELKERMRLKEKIAEESRKEIALNMIKQDRKERAEEQERLKLSRKLQQEQELKKEVQKETEEQLQLSRVEPSQDSLSYRPYHSSHFRQRFKNQDNQNDD